MVNRLQRNNQAYSWLRIFTFSVDTLGLPYLEIINRQPIPDSNNKMQQNQINLFCLHLYRPIECIKLILFRRKITRQRKQHVKESVAMGRPGNIVIFNAAARLTTCAELWITPLDFYFYFIYLLMLRIFGFDPLGLKFCHNTQSGEGIFLTAA